jgi:hypothetical protein
VDVVSDGRQRGLAMADAPFRPGDTVVTKTAHATFLIVDDASLIASGYRMTLVVKTADGRLSLATNLQLIGEALEDS